MRRIDTSTAVPDLFGPGKPGFRNGNKALAIPATDLNAEFFNALQEEAANVIESAGLTLDPDDNTQLLQAMRIILSNADMIARFTTTGNIVLNGLAVQAGGDWPANLTANDFILVKDQATPANNGWYRAQAGAWTRVVYLDEDNEVSAGMLTKVSEGATLADSIWMLATDNPIDVGTTALTFARKDALDIPDATTAVKGKVALATNAIAEDLTNATLALTAASIANLVKGLLTSWQNVTASRALNTTYTNTDLYERKVAITLLNVNSAEAVLIIDGVEVAYQGASIGGGANANLKTQLYGEVPPGKQYRITVNSGAFSITRWSEKKV